MFGFSRATHVLQSTTLTYQTKSSKQLTKGYLLCSPWKNVFYILTRITLIGVLSYNIDFDYELWSHKLRSTYTFIEWRIKNTYTFICSSEAVCKKCEIILTAKTGIFDLLSTHDYLHVLRLIKYKTHVEWVKIISCNWNGHIFQISTLEIKVI